MAPEMLLEQKHLYGTGLDMYSFGVLFYEMVLGQKAFGDLGRMYKIKLVLY